MNIIYDSTKEVLEGINKLSKLIRPTYGGNGTNVEVVSNLYPYYQTVNDAETIIQAVKLDSEGEKRAERMFKELCKKQDKTAGNGRKTTLIVAEEILKHGYKYNGNKNVLCRELQKLIPVIESAIDEQTKKINVSDVKNVATTASESEEIGSLLQSIYSEIGANGILNIEGSKTYETTYKITNGVRFENTGMLSPDMVYDEEARKEKKKENKAVYEKPNILITKKKISNDEDINPLLKEIAESENKNLVIFTNDMDSNVASMLVNLHKNGGFTDRYGNFKTMHVLIIKAPSLWQNYIFEDFAKCTGATIIEDATGLNFKNMKLEHLGTCDRIEVDQEDTILTGINDITEHCKQLHVKGDDDSFLRLSWLATKSAVLKLGAVSHQDLSYKRLKANDANRSTYLALQYGVVEGGGKCLDKVADVLPDSDAGNILKTALKECLRQNIANGCTEIPDYIVDASMVIKRAAKNAIGIASTILTAPALVYIPQKTPLEMELEIAQLKNNPFQ